MMDYKILRKNKTKTNTIITKVIDIEYSFAVNIVCIWKFLVIKKLYKLKTVSLIKVVLVGLSIFPITSYSGFSSYQRENLSPFTKDFRGEEQINESIDYFFRPTL